MKGNRKNKGKVQWSLVDFKSLEPMVRVLEFGVLKYGRENWKKGLEKREILESLLRHAFSLINGETTDKESGEPHIGHILCNAMFYSYFENNENGENRQR